MAAPRPGTRPSTVIAATEITNAGSRKNKQVNVFMVLAIVWIGTGAFPRTGEQSEAPSH
jgi:hypothetical protein